MLTICSFGNAACVQDAARNRDVSAEIWNNDHLK